MMAVWLSLVVVALVVLGSVLALAGAALSRITRVRAVALREQGRPHAELLVRLAADPPRVLKPVYLAVLCVQNGAGILVAILSEHVFGGLGVTLVSLLFTVAYFVLVEAMSKTFAVLHS